MAKKMWLISSLCKHPRTSSFRDADMFKTVNSVFLDPMMENEIDAPESWFKNSSESASLSAESSLEMVVRGVRRSERLFFEPGVTSSILEEAKSNGFRYKESDVLVMESEDLYGDFRRSMEEMVQSHGFKDLEGLLGWYLKVNGENHHGFIVGAFLDLLTALAAASNSNSNSNSASDSASFNSTVSSSPLHEEVGVMS